MPPRHQRTKPGNTLTSGTEASPFAVRSCTAAKRSTTRVGRKGLAFTPRQVGNESILATNDIHCVPKCSSQYRHLNQYQVQVRGYEHISCNVLANAVVKHNSPMDNTSQPLVHVMTLEFTMEAAKLLMLQSLLNVMSSYIQNTAEP